MLTHDDIVDAVWSKDAPFAGYNLPLDNLGANFPGCDAADAPRLLCNWRALDVTAELLRSDNVCTPPDDVTEALKCYDETLQGWCSLTSMHLWSYDASNIARRLAGKTLHAGQSSGLHAANINCIKLSSSK
jgi:hypothetical protein